MSLTQTESLLHPVKLPLADGSFGGAIGVPCAEAAVARTIIVIAAELEVTIPAKPR